jgi:ATP-dependent Clp protease ATP-binding subunit ClpC
MLLQIMEEGKLTDSFGRRVDFRNTILIMTSNIGADIIKNQAGLGFRKKTAEASYEQTKDTLMKEIERHFRPEFLNRVDDTIVFRQLTRDDLKDIVDIELEKIRQRLRSQGLVLELNDEAKELIIDKGYDPDFGARPLRRALEHLIEDHISEELLRGSYKGKDLIRVSVKEDHLYFEGATREKAEEEQEETPVELPGGT